MTTLACYRRYFETLSPASLGELDAVFAPDAHFRDPFNDVRGREAIRRVFAHMFEVCEAPRFEVIEAVNGVDAAYLRWHFHFRLRGRPRIVDGVSRVRFDEEGRVVEHLDYWDPAGGLYEHLPVVGALMRWLRKRVAAE